MKALPQEYQLLCEAFDALPGIGPDNARRLTEWLVYRGNADSMAGVLSGIASLTVCEGCNRLARMSLCDTCTSFNGTGGMFLVVDSESSFDRIRSAGFKGPHFVLHGELSPTRGVGPSDLKMNWLFARLTALVPDSLLLATGGSVEGRATAEYIARRSGIAGRILTVPEVLEQLESSVE